MNAELEIRRKELDESVRKGRTKPAEREFILESLEAIVDTLQWLARIEPILKQRLFNGDQAPVGGCW